MTKIIHLSDYELIKLLKDDNAQAFGEIYDRYAESLAGFAGSKLYHLEDARDLLHDVFAKLWEDRQTTAVTSNLRSYLFSALRYKVIDKIRSNVTRYNFALQAQDSIKLEHYGAQHYLEAKELEAIIEKSLEDLAPKAKEIFLLSRREHHSIKEISEMLDISEQTVKNQITTVLNHLRKVLQASVLAGGLIYLWIY